MGHSQDPVYEKQHTGNMGLFQSLSHYTFYRDEHQWGQNRTYDGGAVNS